MDECERLFLEKIAVAETYPDSLIHQDERRPALRSCLEHYAANRDAIFDGPPSRIDTPLIIIDFDGAESWSKEEGPRRVNLHIIRNVIGLRRKLAWPSPSEITMKSATLVRDPALRIVLLERLSPASLLLNLSEKVLLELLTYHQVPTCLLNFLTSGGESWSFASSMRFAGFRGTASLASRQGTAVASLGRSGSHIQLCFTMFSMRRYPLHAWPKGEDASKTPHWQPHAAAVYVHFDVVEGTAVWLFASPRSYHREKGKGTQNLLWDTMKERFAGTLEGMGALGVADRFRVSLDCLLAVAEWAVEELSPHFQDLELHLSKLTKPYLHPFDEEDDAQTDAIHEVDLRRMAFLMEQRHRSAMRVDNNLRVLRCLRETLVEKVSDELDRLDLRHAGEMQAHLDNFKGELSSAIKEMEDLMQRAQALDKLAENREEYIQRMQTHHANQQMKSIAELTADDSAAMKQLSFIALILLPVTVVSTVLSTDIVKFQDLPNENESASAAGEGPPDAPVPVFSFSVAAFGTWAVASLVMTVVTLAIVKPMGGRRGGANKKTSLRLPRLVGHISTPWKLGGVVHTAEGRTTTPSEPSPVARSIHTAPAVGKTASQCPETPVVGVGGPVQAGASQTLTSMGRWLKGAWGTLWRWQTRRTGEATSAAAAAGTGLPR